MVVRPARRLFTVDEYYRMAEVGILGPEDRVELLDGEIVEMSPIGPRHASIVNRLTHTFIERLGRRVVVTPQHPARLDDLSEPEPDVCLAHARDDFYSSAHPRPEDLYLVIEVADTSLSYDLDRKVPRYAMAGIPEVWVIDLPHDRIEVFRDPTPSGYTDHASLGRGDRICPQAFEDVVLDVSEILGKAST